MQVSGEFEVQMEPLESYAQGGAGTTLGRMSIDKAFTGGLKGSSRGEMLSAMSPIQGSAGYVAVEQVTGTLSGRSGTFVLQHYGRMQGGLGELKLEVVPDSGTGELAGLSGSMAIDVSEGKHRYEFTYELAEMV